MTTFTQTLQRHLHSQCGATTTSVYLPNIYITPEETPDPLITVSPMSPLLSPWQHQSALSLWVYPFRTFHRNGILQYKPFCVWLFSLCLIFLRFIHIAACMHLSFLLSYIETLVFSESNRNSNSSAVQAGASRTSLSLPRVPVPTPVPCQDPLRRDKDGDTGACSAQRQLEQP